MNKRFSKAMLDNLRKEMDAAIAPIAKKNGLIINFGRATYEATTANFPVDVTFAPTADYDPARDAWNRNCYKINMEPEDYGKVFVLQGSTEEYQIAGYSNKGGNPSVFIRKMRNGQELTVTPEAVRLSLGLPDGKLDKTRPVSDTADAKVTWNLHCWRLRLRPEDFDKTVIIHGASYRICGLIPNETGKSVRVYDDRVQKEYKVDPDTVRRALGREE